MQEVAKRALEEYLAAHPRRPPLEVGPDVALDRYAAAIEELSRWTD